MARILRKNTYSACNITFSLFKLIDMIDPPIGAFINQVVFSYKIGPATAKTLFDI